MTEAPTTAWTEVQFDGESVSITLMTEGNGEATVETTSRFTLDEIEEKAGDFETLRASAKTRQSLQQREDQLSLLSDSVVSYSDLDTQVWEGCVLKDKNAPVWSENDRVEILQVTDQTASEYLIEGDIDGFLKAEPTVADANPSYPANNTVVIGRYTDQSGDREYAFPVSRFFVNPAEAYQLSA